MKEQQRKRQKKEKLPKLLSKNSLQNMYGGTGIQL